MKLNIPAVCLSLLLPLAAHAGKEERDFTTQQLEPGIAAAKEALKKNCTADVKFNINYDTLKTKDDLTKVMLTARSITEDTAKYCSDKGTKAAISKLKTIDYTKSDKTDLSFANGKISVTTDGNSYAGWDAFASAIDK
jgi:hypothetical protein